MDTNHVARIVDALDSAIAILRVAEGRRNAADIRVQSILAAARDTLVVRKTTRVDHPHKGEPPELSLQRPGTEMGRAFPIRT